MPFKRISIDEAFALIDAGEATIADVRDAEAHRTGNIVNSVNIQQENVEEFLSTANREKPLIVYCYHGHASQGAADYFSEQGFVEVYSIDGGYAAWQTKY
jgi:thiosulfate sulfurtransferase